MEIPQSFYYIIGTLIIANLGSLVALITFIFKAGMFVQETKLGIKNANDTGIRAHKRIDKLEDKI